MSEKVVTQQEGSISILTLNRPEVHNCVDGETAVAIAEAINMFGNTEDARVLVITGAGDKSFCAGADLKAGLSLMQHEWTDRAGPMGFARLDPGKPTIAAVNGYAFAGGLELACWCDFRIAAANAEFGALSRRWGVPYVDGGTQRLPRIVGTGNALYLLETGARIDARRAYEMGFVQEVVPEGEALKRALQLAEHIGGYPQSSLRADRAGVLAAFANELDEGLLFEASTGRATLTDLEMLEGMQRFAAGERPEPPRSPG
jgi:enoyl-CoA hydratase/carnithine racemase